MTDKSLSELRGEAPAARLTGDELLELSQGGDSVAGTTDDLRKFVGDGTYFGALFGETDVPHGYNLTKKGVVIHTGASGSWKESRIEGPQVFWDAKIGKYRMVYLGYSGTKASPNQASIGFATADGPDGPWTEYASNPVLPPSGTPGDPDENGCSAPHVWFESGTYYLFYLGLTSVGLEQGDKSICLATSSDFLNWTRHGAVILPQASTWRADAVWHPNIVKRSNLYYLFFNANTGAESIGYATSTDLLTWSVDDVNSPVLSIGTGWESARVGDPYVWRKGEVWYMTYYAAGASGASQEGLSWTFDKDFPLGWAKFNGNPIIANTAGSFDSHDAGRGAVLVTPTRLYHWYTTGDGASPPTIEIALAVDDTLYPATTGVQSIQAGPGVSVDTTDPRNPIISATGGGSGGGFVGARAINVGSVAVGSTTSLVPLPTEEFDTSGIYDAATSQFVVPVGMAGRWRVSYACIKTTGSGTLYLFVRKNGAADANNIQGSAAGGASMNYAFKSFVTSLNVGDVLTLNCFSSSAGTIGSAADSGLGTSMEMEYLG